MIVWGIDPGMKGGIAALEAESRQLRWLEDVPIVGKQVAPTLLRDLVNQTWPDMVVIELPGIRPQQATQTGYKIGLNYGVLLGVFGALDIPVQAHSSTKWKGAMRLSSDKELSRRRALETWPSMSHRLNLKRHDGRAEAALIALWAVQHLPLGTD
jgi:crossover junction endodeoxyribonuclease RuvC